MDLQLNQAVLGVERSGIRPFAAQIQNTPGAYSLSNRALEENLQEGLDCIRHFLASL